MLDMSFPGLPFGRFDGQILPLWPFFKALDRQKLIWPKQQKLAKFWPHVESNKNTKKTTTLAQAILTIC